MCTKEAIEKYTYTISYDKRDQIFVVRVQELPGCTTHGHTHEEALINKNIAIRAWINAALEAGREIPGWIGAEKMAHIQEN